MGAAKTRPVTIALRGSTHLDLLQTTPIASILHSASFGNFGKSSRGRCFAVSFDAYLPSRGDEKHNVLGAAAWRAGRSGPRSQQNFSE